MRGWHPYGPSTSFHFQETPLLLSSRPRLNLSGHYLNSLSSPESSRFMMGACLCHQQRTRIDARRSHNRHAARSRLDPPSSRMFTLAAAQPPSSLFLFLSLSP